MKNGKKSPGGKRVAPSKAPRFKGAKAPWASSVPRGLGGPSRRGGGRV